MDDFLRLRILVVDDHRDTADTMVALARLWGYEPVVAYNAETALECISGLDLDAVLLDIGLPQTSGYDIARAVRAGPRGQDVTLIAVTGWCREPDRLRAKMAGFDHHLAKPVDPAELKKLLTSLDESRGDSTKCYASVAAAK
jgi:CheY-like chemotaxis protein